MSREYATLCCVLRKIGLGSLQQYCYKQVLKANGWTEKRMDGLIRTIVDRQRSRTMGRCIASIWCAKKPFFVWAPDRITYVPKRPFVHCGERSLLTEHGLLSSVDHQSTSSAWQHGGRGWLDVEWWGGSMVLCAETWPFSGVVGSAVAQPCAPR